MGKNRSIYRSHGSPMRDPLPIHARPAIEVEAVDARRRWSVARTTQHEELQLGYDLSYDG
jgi:hypothetical protein